MAPPSAGPPAVIRTVSDLVLDMRLASNLTCGAVADALGISRNTLHNWETGAHEPTVTAFFRLAAVCGADPVAALSRLPFAR